MTNMREALEALVGALSNLDEIPVECVLPLCAARTALSAVPAPVLEEEIEVTDSNWKPKKISCRQLAEWIAEQAINERTGFIQRVAKAIEEDRKATRARLSRTEGDTEESIRTRLDEQAVKSSGGVRTSTGKE